MIKEIEKTQCPYFCEYRENCFCNTLTSLNISRTLYYCIKNYHECYIFRKFADKEKDEKIDL